MISAVSQCSDSEIWSAQLGELLAGRLRRRA